MKILENSENVTHIYESFPIKIEKFENSKCHAIFDYDPIEVEEHIKNGAICQISLFRSYDKVLKIMKMAIFALF